MVLHQRTHFPDDNDIEHPFLLLLVVPVFIWQTVWLYTHTNTLTTWAVLHVTLNVFKKENNVLISERIHTFSR